MLRIGSGLDGTTLRAVNAVDRAARSLQEVTVRLATLQRINRGSDDPAGLVASEELRAEITALERQSASTEQVRSQVHVADSALGQAGQLLSDLRGHVVAAASDGTSESERAALQLEIDAAVEAVDRLGQTTEFGGRRLLDGSTSLAVVGGADLSRSSSVELPALSRGELGLHEIVSGGVASLNAGDLNRTMNVIDGAADRLLSARAELGAFEHATIDASQAATADAVVNLRTEFSRITDTDVAFESANWVRAMIQSDVAVATVRLTNQSRGLLAELLRGW